MLSWVGGGHRECLGICRFQAAFLRSYCSRGQGGLSCWYTQFTGPFSDKNICQQINRRRRYIVFLKSQVFGQHCKWVLVVCFPMDLSLERLLFLMYAPFSSCARPVAPSIVLDRYKPDPVPNAGHPIRVHVAITWIGATYNETSLEMCNLNNWFRQWYHY